MLEVDVDIGRLAAILGNEAGEQEIALVRIDRRDAKAKANGAVRRRAAALAEDFLLLPAGEGHDIMDGDEIARIVELGDERQLFVKPLGDIGGHAVGVLVFRVALLRSRPGEIRKMLLGGFSFRHRLVGIFVCELAEREAAGFGDFDGAGDGVGKAGEQPRHLRRRLQMAFGIDGKF